MKKRLIFSLLILSIIQIQAQEADTVAITREGSWGVNFANVGLSNWAAGVKTQLP